MSDLFVLSGQDEDKSGPAVAPEVIKNDDGSYIVMVRFRNLDDHNKFAKLIGQDDLRKFIKSGKSKTVWPAETNPLEDMFG